MKNHRLHRLRQITQILILSTVYCLLSTPLEAAVWENIPIFPQSQKVKEEESTVNANKVQTAIYTTAAAPEEVTGFYKTKLVNFGWAVESETNQQGINLIVFHKDDKIVNLMLQNILGKNFITITQSQITKPAVEEEVPCTECEKQKEELKKKLKLSEGSRLEDVDIERLKEALPQDNTMSQEDAPGKDLQFVPRYPGAVRVNNVERESGKKVNLAYYSQDSIDSIVNFYQQNMGNYYWNLENEIDFQDLPEKLAEQINTDIKGKSLVFKSPSSSCIISIIEEPQNKGTIIGVNYNEK